LCRTLVHPQFTTIMYWVIFVNNKCLLSRLIELFIFNYRLSKDCVKWKNCRPDFYEWVDLNRLKIHNFSFTFYFILAWKWCLIYFQKDFRAVIRINLWYKIKEDPSPTILMRNLHRRTSLLPVWNSNEKGKSLSWIW